jgi:hypothetical protein
MLPGLGPQFMCNSCYCYSGPQYCNQDMINYSQQSSDPLRGLEKETASHQQKLCMQAPTVLLLLLT